jgi:hypothetical protein
MTNKSRANQTNKPKNKSIQVNTDNSHTKNLVQTNEGKQSENYRTENHCEPMNGKQQNNKGEIANKIAIIGLVVNVIMAIVTYSLYKEAVKGSNTAKDALEVTKTEFLSINQPFLQTDIIKIDPFVVGKNLSIIFSIRNIGIYPAKLTNLKISEQISKEIPDFFVKDSPNTLTGNVYITKDNPIVIPTNELTPIITEGMLDEIRKPGVVLYIEMYMEYKNLIDGSNRNYSCIILVDYKRNAKTAYVLNENANIK